MFNCLKYNLSNLINEIKMKLKESLHNQKQCCMLTDKYCEYIEKFFIDKMDSISCLYRTASLRSNNHTTPKTNIYCDFFCLNSTKKSQGKKIRATKTDKLCSNMSHTLSGHKECCCDTITYQ